MKYNLDNNVYEVIITRKNNKNIYVRVGSDLKISVTCNYLTDEKQILKILDNNQKALIKMFASRVKQNARDEEFYYFGEIYDIIIVPTIDTIDIVDKYIYVKDEKMLSKWVNEQILKIFSEHYNYWYQHFSAEIPYYRLRFRNMKTRWGVCNKKSKTITLNTNLFKYDISCLDYVIVHELSHLIYFDHSKNFWNLVFVNYPNYKQVKKLLK